MMLGRRALLSSLLALFAIASAYSQVQRLSDNTLRVDYTFSGNARECRIYLDELNTFPGWAGRRANTENYGGGGIFNSYTLTAAHHPTEAKVVVHEFGHSFGGLADEYYYDDQYENYYNSQTEPWEQNITTQVDFDSKWRDMIAPETPVPTPAPVQNPRAVRTGKERKEVGRLPEVGLYEGGGYMSKGVWRGSFDCRMHTNGYPDFCPVCKRALERIIRYYTEQTDRLHLH